jgi:molecular chaperone GrpE (heat shock protein)
MRQLTDALELAIEQKRQLEIEAAEQGATSRTLQDSNDKLSARTLTLAADAARAAAGPEARVVTLEARVKELEDALKSAQDDLENMRNAEQSQRITLLDELNSMQTEIGNLKNQLKAEQQKKK